MTEKVDRSRLTGSKKSDGYPGVGAGRSNERRNESGLEQRKKQRRVESERSMYCNAMQ